MIIAYASANADPINNPLSDAEVDLATATTPATVSIYGDAVDTEDAGASFSFAWTLLDPTSGPVLSATNTQNITVSNISAWHNIRLHLVATNTATSATSETDILLAPSASFVEIRVLSELRGIQKVAKGSRSWHPALEDWADAIETPINVNDLSDVSNATGAELDKLRSGSLAEISGSVLHTHSGSHVNDATTGAAGVVQLEEASDATGTPRVLTQEHIIYSAHVSASIEADGTRHNEIIATSDAGDQIALCVFVPKRHAIKVHGISIALQNCGATNTDYVFKVSAVSNIQYEANNLNANVIATFTVSPSAAGSAVYHHEGFATPLSVGAGAVLALWLDSSPASGSGGQGLNVTVESTRSVT